MDRLDEILRIAATEPAPPRLSMDAYADFVSRNASDCSLERINRQKEIEERITTPFRLPGKNRRVRARA